MNRLHRRPPGIMIYGRLRQKIEMVQRVTKRISPLTIEIRLFVQKIVSPKESSLYVKFFLLNDKISINI